MRHQCNKEKWRTSGVGKVPKSQHKLLPFYHQDLASNGKLSHTQEHCTKPPKSHWLNEESEWNRLQKMMELLEWRQWMETKKQHGQVKDSTCRSFGFHVLTILKKHVLWLPPSSAKNPNDATMIRDKQSHYFFLAETIEWFKIKKTTSKYFTNPYWKWRQRFSWPINE